MRSNVDTTALPRSHGAFGLCGWWNTDNKTFVPMDWSNEQNLQSNKLYEICLSQCNHASHKLAAVPVYFDEEVTKSSVYQCLFPLGFSNRSSKFFNQHSAQPTLMLDDKSPKHFVTMPEKSPMAILMAYCLYAARFSPRNSVLLSGQTGLGNVLTTLVTFTDVNILAKTTSNRKVENNNKILDYPAMHVTQARLLGELAMLILTDPSNQGTCSSIEFVKSFLNSTVVSDVLSDDSSNVRDVLVTALCRSYIRLFPVFLISLLSKNETLEALKKENIKSNSDVFSGSSSTTVLPSTCHVMGTGAWVDRTGYDVRLRHIFEPILEPVSSDNEQTKEATNTANIERLENIYAQSKADFECFIHCGLILLSTFSP